MQESYLAPSKIEEFRKKIIGWYEIYGEKNMPWRSASDGWAVLVASFLLRKTTAVQVAKVYREFLKRYPNPQALLSASEEEVKEIIRPLGIEHQRSKLLLELAEEIIKKFNGKLPCSKEKLKGLPGVGEYIASEVLLLACGQPEPLLDRNMIRVIERFFGIKSPKKRSHTDKALWSFAKALVPPDSEKAKKFNFGVLDFARKICTAENPKCIECFIRDLCIFASRIK